MSGTATDSVNGQSASTSVSGAQTGNVSGQSSNPQTVGGATGGIPNLKLPVSGLYTYNTAPDANYLVVTDPRFTQYSSFISSDYMLGQLGFDPSKTEKRLGDGMYEQTLVRNQVTQLTGRTFLTGYTSNLDEYTALMNSGVTYAKEFGLQPGLALSPTQMQQLTTDMVWLVSQDVTLPDGSHQTVLVPQVYLAQSSTVDLTHSGALVAGNAVNLNASGDVTNSGHVTSNLATTIIGNNVVNSGVIGSGGMTAVVAVQDVRNTSGRIGGGDVVVQAGRDVINETQTYGVSQTFTDRSFTGRVATTGVDAIGTISSTGDAAVIAGRDVNLNGALIQAGGNAAVAAGRDLNVGAVALTATKDSSGYGGQNFLHDAVTQNLGSAIIAGGSLATVSGRDTTLTGATVSAGGDATLVAGGNLLVTAGNDTHARSEQSMNDSRSQYAASSYDEAAQGSNVGAGGNVTLAAGQNGSGSLAILGSTVSADTGGVKLVSTGDVTIGSVSETHDAQNWSHNQHSGFLSKETVNDTNSSHQVIAAGSTVSGDTVTGAAGHDMTISGSTVAATHDVTLAAVNNLTVNTTQDTSESSTFHEDKKSGFGTSGGFGISYGNVNTKDTAHDGLATNNASLIGSTDGSVNLSAGNDLHVTGSDLIAAQNVTGTGANVTIDAATGATHHDETHERKQSGFTLALAGSVGDAVNGAVQQSQAIRGSASSGNDRAAALHAIAAGGDAAIAVAGATGGALAGQNPSIAVQLSYGTSKSTSTASEDQATQAGSRVQAGGTAAFVATGNGTPGSGNVTIAGSDVSANDVLLAAKNQVNVINTTDTDSTRSSNSSSSASVGVSIGSNGIGISASMQNAHGDGNSDASIQNASHVSGANSVTVVSGGDTNIIGSQINGRQIAADVGGRLNITSVQDVTNSAAHQSSAGGGFTISQGGGSASFSAQNGHADSNYAGVNEQAGLHAGSGGFDINVKGRTNLKGAVIASDADASKNTLTTGTLSFSDIQNQSHYSAASNGISAGAGVGITGKATGPGSVSGSGGPVPMMSQDENGDQSATTRSAISAGAINITNRPAQTQDVASLSRDTTNTNGTVSKTPDVNDNLNKQADTMQAAQAAGQVVAQGIGAYADMKRDDAVAALQSAKDRGDTEGMAAALVDYNNWKEGGTNRIGLHIAGGALVAGLGGGGAGSAAQGAAGAGVAAWTAGDLNRIANGTRDALGGGDAAQTAGNVLANVVAGAGGFLIGGTTGAFTAGNVDLYNRSTGNGDGHGSTENSALGDVVDWAKSTYGSPVDDVRRWAGQLAGQVASNNGQALPADPNPLIDVTNNSKPPAAGGSAMPVVVCVPPMCTVAVVPTPGTPGYVPSNAILNSGSDGDSSRLVDGGGLQAHEDAGGHLLDRHVGQSEQDLATRLVNEPQISGSSSFPDRATAERVVSQTLDANQSTIADWLAGGSSRLRLDYSSSDPTGISVSKGTSGAVDVNSARVILVRDPSMPTGYRVLTGYPTKP